MTQSQRFKLRRLGGVGARPPWVFVLPSFFFLLALAVYPMVFSIYLSLTDATAYGEIHKIVGGANYANLFGDPFFINALTVTATYAAGAVPLELLLGLALANLLNRSFRGRSVFVMLLLSPLFVSPIIVGQVWKFMLQGGYGVLNYFYSIIFKVPEYSFLGNPKIIMSIVILVDVWRWTPFMVLTLFAALQGVRQDVYEAAREIGASEWTIFRRITLPMLKGIILVIVLIRLIDVIKEFPIVYGLTTGGPGVSSEVLSILTWRMFYVGMEVGRAMALGWIQLLLLIIIGNAILRTIFRRRAE